MLTALHQDIDLSKLSSALSRNLENIGASIDLNDLSRALTETLSGSNSNLLSDGLVKPRDESEYGNDPTFTIDLGNADDVLTQRGLDLIKTMRLDVLNEDTISVGNLELGQSGNLLFDGTMNIGDAEGLIHGPMIIGAGSNQYNGLFQGDLTLFGEAGIIQGDAGVGGKPVLRLGLGGDRGLIVGLGEMDLIGGSASNGGDGVVTTWNQNLEEYRSSTAAAATATARATSSPATNTAAATTTAADASSQDSCGLLGLGCALNGFGS